MGLHNWINPTSETFELVDIRTWAVHLIDTMDFDMGK